MQEIRCKKCNKLLAKTRIEAIKKADSIVIEKVPYVTEIEIKCPRCGEMNVRKENINDKKRVVLERD